MELVLFVYLYLPDPHLLARHNLYPVAPAALTRIKQSRKRRICIAIQALPATGYPDDVDPGALQQGPPAAGLKAEFYGTRDHTAQFTDLDINGKHSPSTGVLLADVDDALGYGHLMHFTTPWPNAG
jgi:hypothetical protein